MCAANATTVQDSTMNRKFAKTKATGRIDGMIALAMAVSLMSRTEQEGDWDGMFGAPVAFGFH
jgi:phage terminase large subunit-like protein